MNWDLCVGSVATLGTHICTLTARDAICSVISFYSSPTIAVSMLGGWVKYKWRNGEEPVYEKSSYVVKLTRNGREYYLGGGMGNNPWDNQNASWTAACSAEFSAPCSEDWAAAVTGRRMKSLLLAHNSSEVLDRLEGREAESPFGFATTVILHGHGELTGNVMADKEQSYVGLTAARWLLEVRRSYIEQSRAFDVSMRS